MKKVVVWADDNKRSHEIAEKVCFTFPCFVRVRKVQEGVIEVEVECREEDVTGVERMLATIV